MRDVRCPYCGGATLSRFMKMNVGTVLTVNVTLT